MVETADEASGVLRQAEEKFGEMNRKLCEQSREPWSLNHMKQILLSEFQKGSSNATMPGEQKGSPKRK